MYAHPIKMNFSTSFALLAVFAVVVSTITVSSAAYAESLENRGLPDACVGCNTDDSIAAAVEMLLQDVPISVETDKETYTHDDMVMLTGYVANPIPGGANHMAQVTVVVKNPIGSIVTIDQVDINEDKTFESMINTGGRLWSYDGVYTIHVQHGQSTNKVQIDLVGGLDNPLRPTPPPVDMHDECTSTELTFVGLCVPYSIEGGEVTGADVNTDDMSLVISIEPTGMGGVLTLMPSSDVISGVFMVLVDNEESNDYMISDDGTITIPFGPESEVVEVIGTYVIPEFGTIAVMILAVAIIVTIAVSSRSRLGMIAPRM